MPELAQLAHMAQLINDFSAHVFHTCLRSAVGGLSAPLLPIPRCWLSYSLSAQSRGKELRLSIRPVHIDERLRREEELEQQRQEAERAQQPDVPYDAWLQGRPSPSSSLPALSHDAAALVASVREHLSTWVHVRSLPLQRSAFDRCTGVVRVPLSGPMHVLFRMGMSGKFAYVDLCDPAAVSLIHVRSHLTFLSSSPHPLAVVFADARRYGNWAVTDGWGERRGPDPVTEYAAFRANVLEHLDAAAFNGRLCEALLDQEFFNGIGNYLRAEICYRAGVDPFVNAREALRALPRCSPGKDQPADLLSLCRDVSCESVELGSLYQPSLSVAEQLSIAQRRKRFREWKRCYNKPGMVWTRDATKRKMWHQPSWRIHTQRADLDQQPAEQQRTERRKRAAPREKRQARDAGAEEAEGQTAEGAEEGEADSDARRRRRAKQCAEPSQSASSTEAPRREEEEEVVELPVGPRAAHRDSKREPWEEEEAEAGVSATIRVHPRRSTHKRKAAHPQRSAPSAARRRSARLAGWEKDNPILLEE